MEDLFTVPEVAKLLRLSPATIRAWICQGRIIPIRLGRRTVFEQSEIERVVRVGRKKGLESAES